MSLSGSFFVQLAAGQPLRSRHMAMPRLRASPPRLRPLHTCPSSSSTHAALKHTQISRLFSRSTKNQSPTSSDLHSGSTMSQEQARRPSGQQQETSGGGEQQQGGAVRYGDVFPAVCGSLAEKPVAPQDAATMQSAESLVFGQTLRGGPAAAMQSAATANERMGAVGHDEATDATAVEGVTVAETRVPGGGRVATEFVAGQAVGQYHLAACAGGADMSTTKVTIGEALEATALAAGDEPVERSDAAAIQAAEARATGLDANVPGGLAAQAQSAAAANEWAWRGEDKATLGDVLANATARLVADKPVESADAVGVAGAENRNRDDGTARPGGVAASMAAAARLNRDEAVWE